jgi:phosphohistidine swiveling domain-containing protein
VILLRPKIVTATPGIAQMGGILAASGSRTSQAAVVARQMEKVRLVGGGRPASISIIGFVALG